MALDQRWIDRLFERLTLAYGVAFLRQWDGIDLDEVKRFWAEALDGLNAERIGYGLGGINPDKSPNAHQFRQACLRAPERTLPALKAPKADPAVVDAVMRAFKRVEVADAKAWARKLKEREEAGERLGLIQSRFWREALVAE